MNGELYCEPGGALFNIALGCVLTLVIFLALNQWRAIKKQEE